MLTLTCTFMWISKYKVGLGILKKYGALIFSGYVERVDHKAVQGIKPALRQHNTNIIRREF